MALKKIKIPPDIEVIRRAYSVKYDDGIDFFTPLEADRTRYMWDGREGNEYDPKQEGSGKLWK